MAGDKQLTLISKIDISGKYFYDMSSNGEYILINVPRFTEGAAEYDPGGKYRLYSIFGKLLWERQSKENMFFSTNNKYLVQPLNMEFKTPGSAKVLTISDFTIESIVNIPEIHIVSMDVDKTGKYYLLGEDNGNITIVKDGGIIWQNASEISSFTDVAFSKDGKYFMESLNERLFRIDENSIKELNINHKKSSLPAEANAVDIYFNQTNNHYQYLSNENTIYFVDKTKAIDKVKSILREHYLNNVVLKYDMNLCYFAAKTDNELLIYKNKRCN